MKRIQLQLAKLRKARNMTQQELSDIVGTSCQNISKWENGTTTPDITVLPVLADIFQVSVDELLGLVPLKGERYLPEGTDTEDFWDKHLEYLLRTRKTGWNLDYLQFLIRDVWKIEHPVNVLDCGCGYAYMALLLMPLLPKGSTYTGVDFSRELISHGESLLKKAGMQGKLLHEDFCRMHTGQHYDVVLCQSVLRHIGDSHNFIKKMIELGTPGALLICIDSNRELESAGLYIEGMDYAKLCDHQGAWKHWRKEKENGERDYAAAMRNAFVMRELGLKHIQVRMNDRMSFVCPETPGYKQLVEDFIQYNRSWYQDGNEVERLMSHGMTRGEAENYVQKGKTVARFCEEHSEDVSYLSFRGKTIAFGWLGNGGKDE